MADSSTRGKTIQIYLPDGNPKGIKVCEIPNSIIRAIVIPRNEIKKAIESESLSCVGIYFLFSDKDELGKFKTYIGEAEDIANRLRQHDASEKEWNYAVCFLSGKNNLNKAHVKFLESYCHGLAKEVGISELGNNVSPTRSNLSKPDEDFVLNFFDDLRILIGTLGYPIFEVNKRKEGATEIFFCKRKYCSASGNLTEDGFLVYKGSMASLEDKSYSNKAVPEKRKKLIEEGILEKKGEYLVFVNDFVFNSPSMAAAVVVGGNANGWNEWKTKTGKTLDEIKRQENKS